MASQPTDINEVHNETRPITVMDSNTNVPAEEFSPERRVLKRGDLVRVRERRGYHHVRHRDGGLGRVLKFNPIPEEELEEGMHRFYYDIEWVLGGRLSNVKREELIYTTADAESLTGDSRSRRKRKPSAVIVEQEETKSCKVSSESANKKNAKGNMQNKTVKNTAKTKSKAPAAKKVPKNSGNTAKKQVTKKAKTLVMKKSAKSAGKLSENKSKPGTSCRKKVDQDAVIDGSTHSQSNALSLYEKHRREFERVINRLQKMDRFGVFLGETPAENDEHYGNDSLLADEVSAKPLSPAESRYEQSCRNLPLPITLGVGTGPKKICTFDSAESPCNKSAATSSCPLHPSESHSTQIAKGEAVESSAATSSQDGSKPKHSETLTNDFQRHTIPAKLNTTRNLPPNTACGDKDSHAVTAAAPESVAKNGNVIAHPDLDQLISVQISTPADRDTSVSQENVISKHAKDLHEGSPDGKDPSDRTAKVVNLSSPTLKTPESPKTTKKRSKKRKRNEGITFPDHPPYNWSIFNKRMQHGRYVMDLNKEDEQKWKKLLGSYKYWKRKHSIRSTGDWVRPKQKLTHPCGVHWDLIRQDVLGMCDAAITRNPEDSVVAQAANKIKDAMEQIYSRTGVRQMAEIKSANLVDKYASILAETENNEAAVQGEWRKTAFPERKYERLPTSDVVCQGLSRLDERSAVYELRTDLPNSFIGIAYKYNDTGQSEGWMKSLVSQAAETAKTSKLSKRRKSGDDELRTALALASDEGVVRAQVQNTMQTLLISVQDRVMTDQHILKGSGLRSANWEDDGQSSCDTKHLISTEFSDLGDPEVAEQPVWGIDCYTRRSVEQCLSLEFEPHIAVEFIEKWLHPAINACPVELAHDIAQAARLLESMSVSKRESEKSTIENDAAVQDEEEDEESQVAPPPGHHSLLRNALEEMIKTSRPPWLHAASRLLREAAEQMGSYAFRVHPKGHGSVVLRAAGIPANSLVTYYRGEVYPAWRWGEKMDAIDMTQQRLGLRPRLPDFYNMALERPQVDPRGYGLMFVDASRRGGWGSSLSHSCDPTCEVKVASLNGQLCLAMTTIRDVERGEELTFDYNAVTESLNEYESAVCLCGYRKCRGSFLHFATADCYQQVLNRNSPLAVRFSNLVKGCMKKVMAKDDEQILQSHGFGTAAFGAVGVNHHERPDQVGGTPVARDSMDLVPIWLRTFVADTLRYIEYERRALPIALVCNHLTEQSSTSCANEVDDTEKTSKRKTEGRGDRKHPKKLKSDSAKKSDGPGSKADSVFFFYLKKQTAHFMSILQNQGGADLKGMEARRAMQKLAGQTWRALNESEKNEWRDKATAEWKAKQQQDSDHRAIKCEASDSDPPKESVAVVDPEKAPLRPVVRNGGNCKKDEKKKGRGTKVPQEPENSLPNNAISMDDADAEGISAMEQRIQQLSQSLSRVGRVLDRHRESMLESKQEAVPHEVLRELAHAPVVIMPDERVVSWIWTDETGVVRPLLRLLESFRKFRPLLASELDGVVTKFSFLDRQSSASPEAGTCVDQINLRKELKTALLELRECLIKDVKDMESYVKEFYLEQARTKARARRETKQQNEPEDTMDRKESALDVESGQCSPSLSEDGSDKESTSSAALERPTMSQLRPKLSVVPFICNLQTQSDDETPETKTPSAEEYIPNTGGDVCQNMQQKDATDTNLSVSTSSGLHKAVKEEPPMASRTSSQSESKPADQHGMSRKASSLEPSTLPWFECFQRRYMLQSVADTLLFYAATKTFFMLNPYCSLESSPIEVYARELGNEVPRSVTDFSKKNESTVTRVSLVTVSDAVRTEHTSSVGGSDKAVLSDTNHLEDTHKRVASSSGTVFSRTEQGRSNSGSEFCQPEEVITNVIVKYQGDYVLSQLLQWYNGGIGQKPGLPPMLGCVMLPSLRACFQETKSSEMQRSLMRTKILKTHYDNTVRPLLIDWFGNEHKRGEAWPEEIAEYFDRFTEDSGVKDSQKYHPMGSPVLDFLVAGDDSSIHEVLSSLKSLERSKRGTKSIAGEPDVDSKSAAGMLQSSVDHGRPAQAVANWVQCENSGCLKWRKLPWHVDVDLLPDHFFCKDNIWNPNANSCSSPQDAWDEYQDEQVVDELPDSVQSHVPEVLDKKLFLVGARFDVLRAGKDKYHVGKVLDTATVKGSFRVLFHFSRTNAKFDEWVEVGFNKIRPLGSLTSAKARPPAPSAKESLSVIAASPKVSRCQRDGASVMVSEEDIQKGARFDVLRLGKNKYCTGVVIDIEKIETTTRVKFHFPKMKTKFDEWIQVGSKRIAPLGSKTTPSGKIRIKEMDKPASSSNSISKPIGIVEKSVPSAQSVKEGRVRLEDKTLERDSVDVSSPCTTDFPSSSNSISVPIDGTEENLAPVHSIQEGRIILGDKNLERDSGYVSSPCTTDLSSLQENEDVNGRLFVAGEVVCEDQGMALHESEVRISRTPHPTLAQRDNSESHTSRSEAAEPSSERERFSPSKESNFVCKSIDTRTGAVTALEGRAKEKEAPTSHGRNWVQQHNSLDPSMQAMLHNAGGTASSAIMGSLVASADQLLLSSQLTRPSCSRQMHPGAPRSFPSQAQVVRNGWNMFQTNVAPSAPAFYSNPLAGAHLLTSLTPPPIILDRHRAVQEAAFRNAYHNPNHGNEQHNGSWYGNASN